MTLLPLPALDGGKIFFLVVNAVSMAVIKKQIPLKYENYIHFAGLVLLLALMLQYTLPAPFIIPLFADLGDDAEYVSTTLSLGTVLAVVLFFFLAAFSLA